MHKIQRDTPAYNQRRYSRPWIARVDFASNPNGEYHWGEWVGDHRNGSEGTLVIDAETGDIIATGQKDFRQPRNSSPDWWVVSSDGKLCSLEGKQAAYKLATGVNA
jgi:hypothetical protein